MEKLKPSFALADIKAAFADPARLNRSFVSKQGADGLGMDDAGVVAAIQALTPADFEKSMTSMANSKVWQDVYKPDAGGRRLYVNLRSSSAKRGSAAENLRSTREARCS